MYALGELWLSYTNGEDEAPLLQGGPRSAAPRDESAPQNREKPAGAAPQ